uniref:Uncharacterized protein n=1 Tax=Chromera velia CCMP2878 TaxID=1169474 RepID=A0A0G4HJD0_9ALVE|eukprot:Cvel_28243.t1-p1 / transcript=Cvel_28243.t1 / gene=Cvel_28243 / organism=Chromera_velia_CCMP2878 / gene_product=hypothetical protein / transcript_product=hypothetical protein / location=Cvel_scaffold3658:2589-4005(+) / protein_length=127 / sequence_SO=supercontig / SO=protein_coding / is_pseudo=false
MEPSPIDRPLDSTVAWDAKTAPKAAPKARYWHRIDRLQIRNRVILPYSTGGAKSCCGHDKSVLPHFADRYRGKVTDQFQGPAVKLVGVITHGRCAFYFAVPPEERHGANMTCTALLYVLLYLERNFE